PAASRPGRPIVPVTTSAAGRRVPARPLPARAARRGRALTVVGLVLARLSGRGGRLRRAVVLRPRSPAGGGRRAGVVAVPVAGPVRLQRAVAGVAPAHRPVLDAAHGP